MLENYRNEILSCAICHDQCLSSCPIFSTVRKTTVYPSRKAQIANSLLIKELDWDEDSAELFYYCCGCRQCNNNCVYLDDPKDPIPIFQAARYEAMKQGVKLDFVKEIEEKIKKHGSLYGDLSNELKDIKNNVETDENARILYLVDDETIALSLNSAKSTIKLMKNSKIKFLISSMINTGIDVKALGFFNIAEEMAKEMTDYLNKQDIDKIIVSNPKTYYALTSWYKEMGLKVKKDIELETTFFYEQFIVKKKKLAERENNIPNFIMLDKVGTYQDGSYMARYIMDFDKPRRLVRPLFSHYKEMRTNRKDAVPAAPANYPLGLPESTIEGITKLRVVDIEDIKADYVITSDPLTYHALKKYWNENKVLSISEALLMNYVSTSSQ